MRTGISEKKKLIPYLAIKLNQSNTTYELQAMAAKSIYRQIQILEDNDAFIIAYKPAHVLSIPDRYQPDLLNLYHFLEKKYRQKIYVVHRLDRETSGVICFAKTEEAHKHLSLQFQKRSTTKIYHALIKGKLPQSEGVIDLPLKESSARRGTMKAVKQGGKSALTTYQTLESFRHYTYVSVQISTGRLHQIRVHFQAIGYPLAVDPLYGGEDGFYLSSVKPKYNIGRFDEERPIMGRVSLHAHTLELTHPMTQERLQFTTDLPKDFQVSLKQLRKYDAI